jgi:hypothetical protein
MANIHAPTMMLLIHHHMALLARKSLINPALQTATPRVPAKARDEILAGAPRSASFIISAGTPVIATALFARGHG